MMKKWISILSGLLLAQLVLAVSVNLTGEDYGTFESQEKLLAFDLQSLDGLQIEDDEGKLVLSKQNGKWLLPESDDFPASTGSVDALLEKLAALEKGWPVAKTSAAARRFKVSDEQFERKLSLMSDAEPLAELYVGTSPGFRKVHVRPADEDAIFAVSFNTWEANAKVDDWIDKTVLRLDATDVQRIEMPGFVLQHKDGKLELEGLGAEEETNLEEVNSLMGKLTQLTVESLLGTEAEAKPEYKQGQAELEIKVARKGGDLLTYSFSKPEEETDYVLKRSDLDHYFKVAAFNLKPIKEMTRNKLVKTKSVETPGNTVEKVKPAEASVEAED